MTMYQNALISFGMGTSIFRTNISNPVTKICGMCLVLLKAGGIFGMRVTIFPIQQLLVLLPEELLKNLQALDQPITIVAI